MLDVNADELSTYAANVYRAPNRALSNCGMSCHLRVWSWTGVVLLALQLMCSPVCADVVVFDEDDAVGAGYYDASVPVVTTPSQMTLASTINGGKMIILSNGAYSGTQSGLLEWKSAPGGDWILFVASPGFQTWDVSSYSNVVMFLNGPQAIAAANLPRVGLESSTSARSTMVNLGSYLTSGLDGDTNTWQRVVIPLTAFQPYGSFSPTQFKDVFFRQGASDNVTRTVWLDHMLVADGRIPSAPTGVVSRAGESSVVLHWANSGAVNPAGYNLYRGGSTNGPFTLLNSQPGLQTTFVDFTVTNGQDYFYFVRALNGESDESSNSVTVSASPRAFTNDATFLEYLQQTTFDYFWYEANPTNGLIRDRSEPSSPCSIAAVGFGLTAICVGIDHGWITREQGRQRVLAALQTFYNGPQGTGTSGTIGYKGWFYHMLNMNTATRSGTSELSSIDSGLLLAGVLYVRHYFDANQADENQIRTLADAIFNRVDWLWMANGGNSLTMGWMPESGFISARWIGYNEAMVLYIMGLGAATNPLPPVNWASWTSGYLWRTNYGFSCVQFPPLFGHQYSHCWVDFRHVADAYMNNKGISYFENSRRATLAQRAYCIANPAGFAGYGSNVWGITACDGPGFGPYAGYNARGAPPAQNDDGTLAPTALGGSLPFAAEVCLPALRNLYAQFRTNIWCGYGMRDAFNLSANWWDPDTIGIDQGPILIMAENYRTQNVWRRFMSIPEIQTGLASAGFTNLQFVTSAIQRNAQTAAVTITWPGVVSRSYQVEYSPDFVSWFTSPSGFITASQSTLSWTDSGPPATDSSPVLVPQRFYRVFRFGP